MSIKHDIGNKGEEIAEKYLINKGYIILEKQWRYNRAEIDLICKKDGALIFVEVKSRTSIAFGPPEDFVTNKKKKLMSAAASAYMTKINHEWFIRFDVISIIIHHDDSHELQHFEDAFFLGLNT